MDAFSDYLEGQNETISAFSRRIGRAPSTLTRALSGERRPSDELAAAVAAGTQGKVSEELFILICLAARKARNAQPDRQPLEAAE